MLTLKTFGDHLTLSVTLDRSDPRFKDAVRQLGGVYAVVFARGHLDRGVGVRLHVSKAYPGEHWLTTIIAPISYLDAVKAEL